MENDAKEPTEMTNATQAEDAGGIFSQEEIRDIVKEFIAAYLRGEIAIEFRDAKEIMAIAKMSGKKIDVDSALREEVEGKKPFYDLISLCTGSKQASPEERRKAVCGLFDSIVICRSSGRLKGNLMTFNTEKKLAEIERDLAETKKVVMELVIFYRSIVEGKGKSGDQHG